MSQSQRDHPENQQQQQMKTNIEFLELDERLKHVLSGEKHENGPPPSSTMVGEANSTQPSTQIQTNIQQQSLQQYGNPIMTSTTDLSGAMQQQQQLQSMQASQTQQQASYPPIQHVTDSSSLMNYSSPSANSSLSRRNSVDLKVPHIIISLWQQSSFLLNLIT